MSWGAFRGRVRTADREVVDRANGRRRVPDVREIEGWMSAAGVRRLPSFVAVDDFLQVLAEQRGRRIELMAEPHLPAHLCGAWVATKDADVIVIDAGLTGSQRDLVILHEAAHVVCGHRGDGVLPSRDDLAAAVERVPGAGSGPILLRSHFDDDQEWQAEWLATYLLTRTRGLGRTSWVGAAGGRYAAALLHGHE